MKTNKANDPHPVCYVLRDWSKARKANTVAEKTERIPSLSVLPTTKEIKCARQMYVLPH